MVVVWTWVVASGAEAKLIESSYRLKVEYVRFDDKEREESRMTDFWLEKLSRSL